VGGFDRRATRPRSHCELTGSAAVFSCQNSCALTSQQPGRGLFFHQCRDRAAGGATIFGNFQQRDLPSFFEPIHMVNSKSIQANPQPGRALFRAEDPLARKDRLALADWPEQALGQCQSALMACVTCWNWVPRKSAQPCLTQNRKQNLRRLIRPMCP